MNDTPPSLSAEQIWQLRRLTTPTVYNGWEQITRRDTARDGFNLDDARDFMPDFGPMAGRAVTVAGRVGGPPRPDNGEQWRRFRRHIADQPLGPKIVVLRDLDAPPGAYGSVIGEIAANAFRALGCVGAILDGGVRDIDEIRAAGFKVLARRACVGHGVGTLINFGEPVEVFGRRVEPGQLVHADRHGFLVIPPEDEAKLLDAAVTLDGFESRLLAASRDAPARPGEDLLDGLNCAIERFSEDVRKRFSHRGEF
jgi:4-hydroxy-4-methyl-2-oxoglutarate aldolase